jgi:hypothetical protein
MGCFGVDIQIDAVAPVDAGRRRIALNFTSGCGAAKYPVECPCFSIFNDDGIFKDQGSALCNVSNGWLKVVVHIKKNTECRVIGFSIKRLARIK